MEERLKRLCGGGGGNELFLFGNLIQEAFAGLRGGRLHLRRKGVGYQVALGLSDDGAAIGALLQVKGGSLHLGLRQELEREEVQIIL
jgi:hypothetical protein